MIKVKRLTETAKMPTWGSEKAACFDVYADCTNKILPQQVAKIPIGLAFQPPEGFMLQILQRSGLALKGIIPIGGIVDNDFTGEVSVILLNTTDERFIVRRGSKIAQIALRKYYQDEFVEVDELVETERGNKGFGSSGE